MCYHVCVCVFESKPLALPMHTSVYTLVCAACAQAWVAVCCNFAVRFFCRDECVFLRLPTIPFFCVFVTTHHTQYTYYFGSAVCDSICSDTTQLQWYKYCMVNTCANESNMLRCSCSTHRYTHSHASMIHTLSLAHACQRQHYCHDVIIIVIVIAPMCVQVPC